MPTEPGDYEIRYVLDQDREIIATAMITVGAVTAGITPPQDAPVGATVAVRWEGPDYKRDFIAVAKPDEPYINYVYTKDGNPARVEMPATPGDYELRYVLDQDNLVIATVPPAGRRARPLPSPLRGRAMRGTISASARRGRSATKHTSMPEKARSRS